MKSVKKVLGITAAMIGLITSVSIFGSVSSANYSDKIQIRLAHNQAKESEIAQSIALFSDFVAQDPSKNLEVDIYASGVLGSEKEAIEMVKAGVLDMAKVSSNTLGQFNDHYSIFAMPYLFTGQEHYYAAMEKSEAVKALFKENEEEGYIAIGYYANGARNVYLKENVPATDPSVLKGRKLRSMPSSASMRMLELMGASPVPMSASETYTSLQQGVIDGAENTELALTVDKHAEIAKSYTYTEHQYSPDIYIISTKTWNDLTTEQQDYLVACLTQVNDNFKQMYNRMMEEAIVEAEAMGITVYRDIDKSAFIEAVQPLHEEFVAKGEDYQKLYEDIQQYSGN
ncbi:C4-dicarboxylate ABC transporter [Sporanaerobium hydrogeniformans]|uniref:C4-dicarboxylate ABC transporter n=1 Tax=Sporanaerobium hydrogeniformans TaxID=3072179 RepID=A0AC61DED3_9FIRM|nr:TRAP transporter substrate-binding protein DctP [Sporanaerobium hydrogeniformans]PHV71277.1 C4-dicarboxylate ABC transporter [Sporanaerobium hydrogeniformans]